MFQIDLQCKLARNYTMEGVDKAAAFLLIKAIPQTTTGFIPSIPLNIVLVLDVSGSMYGEKLECAKEAACLVVESLSKNDQLSLVVFNGEAEVMVSRRKVDDKNVFFSKIKSIEASDGTNMHKGMELGLKELGKVEGVISRMFLFTDGLTDEEEECIGSAHKASEMKIPISCLGIGDDYKEDILAETSRVTLGSATHLLRPEEIKNVFEQELKAAAATGFTKAKLDFRLTKGVTLQELHRIMPNIAKLDYTTTDERTWSAEAGSLTITEPTIFGTRLVLPARPAGQVRIAHITLSFARPSTPNKVESLESDIIVEYTKDRDLCGKIDPEVMGYFDQLTAQDLIEQAAQAAKAGNVADATVKLNQAKALTVRIGNAAMAQNLDQALGELKNKGTLSAGSQKTIRLGSAKTIKVDIDKTDI